MQVNFSVKVAPNTLVANSDVRAHLLQEPVSPGVYLWSTYCMKIDEFFVSGVV